MAQIRILVVDDQYPAIALRDVAQAYGVRIDIGRTRKQGAELADEKPVPNLILMDGYLEEEKTSLDLIRRIRRKGYTGPMVATSSSEDLRPQMLEAGCNEAWGKGDIVPKLKEWISNYRAAL